MAVKIDFSDCVWIMFAMIGLDVDRYNRHAALTGIAGKRGSGCEAFCIYSRQPAYPGERVTLGELASVAFPSNAIRPASWQTLALKLHGRFTYLVLMKSTKALSGAGTSRRPG
ncbi:hypothetical protein [Aliirhizobium smilacinae]|uniref:Uncharacterized protein n=1 Tax=Aliirhizobium smilacinae TaxID=1395944 RepID=A0A5C4XIX6_9HYPH|nr:hypothetical protein [Rhizobium smilacinae]TNM62524.1 hypothetical protein FHP24_14875 [Rhizobium smilacinae]